MAVLRCNNTTLGYFIPQEPVTLQTEIKVDISNLRKYPASMEVDIRNQLALALAQKMLEEDLIKIEVDQSGADPLTQYATARAQVKIIQE